MAATKKATRKAPSKKTVAKTSRSKATRTGAKAAGAATPTRRRSLPPDPRDPKRLRRKRDLLNQLRDPGTTPERAIELRKALVPLDDVPALSYQEVARLG